MVVQKVAQIDPVKYEMFLHRLWAIGEEGRITIQRVSASPIVAQGGECIAAFYEPKGTMILSCSGHLRFATATSDAVRRMIEWYSDNPGIYDGDQFFVNDPYVAGAHVYDTMRIKPIFHEGELIAWVATGIHTADTGGVLRGAATEIYHEGIRVGGLKVMERDRLREDAFRTIVDQSRDPDYVALDLKSCIAANNVCARRYLELVKKFGKEFVQAAGEKVIADSEAMARAKLRELPDGTWTSRIYNTVKDRKMGQARPYRIMCTMTKTGDELVFDYTGSSPQVPESAVNSTLAGALSHAAVPLTAMLFWDVPWSDGKLASLKFIVPEGSILNCRFPSACGFATMVGNTMVTALTECIAKMLYAAGRLDEVNAAWYSLWYGGGPGTFYGGRRRDGIRVPQGIYDSHGSGLGAAPNRDGVNTGGHMNIPGGGIVDMEKVEMAYPLLYFTRNHCRDSGGFGKYQGGSGSYRVFMVYGSEDFSSDYNPYGGIPESAFGLFGGYPIGTGGLRAMLDSPGLKERLRAGDYPTQVEELLSGEWGRLAIPEGAPDRINIPEYSLLADFITAGGGFGDPLERPPEKVVHDVSIGLLSARMAEKAYGVVIDQRTGQADLKATEGRRQAIRAERLKEGKPYSGTTSGAAVPRSSKLQPVLKPHEYLDVVDDGRTRYVRCRCGHVLCRAEENYKLYALQRKRDLLEFSGRPLPSGQPYAAVYQEYICPSCATLLQVDVLCPAMDDDKPIWDIKLAL
ncbi:MAG: hydantoinase B/oxoprolinase family protein [Chloroflexi bacterium]|nr:hydantoinase B/oxoprolinase family protein [Chloroflexota bacterium]